MDKSLPIWITEPASKRKAQLAALKAVPSRNADFSDAEYPDIETVKRRIRAIREHTRNNLKVLAESCKDTLAGKYSELHVHYADDSSSAVSYIKAHTKGLATISTNNSAVVAREIMPGLTGEYTVRNHYLSSLLEDDAQKLEHWEVPFLLRTGIRPGFEVTTKLNGLDLKGQSVARNYAAILGVAGIAADDGTVFFLQHYDNITLDLASAGKVFIIVPVDKIYTNKEEAEFSANCMGIFGMESVALALSTRNDDAQSSVDVIPEYPGERELHLVILDNGRTHLSQTVYRDLLLCISCRACIRQCPISSSFSDADTPWSPHSYVTDFILGKRDSAYECIHCEACRVHCPLDIDLPGMIWRASDVNFPKKKRPFRHLVLGRPELVAKSGSFLFPLSQWLLHRKSIRCIMELVLGIDRDAPLPDFHRKSFRRWITERERIHG